MPCDRGLPATIASAVLLRRLDGDVPCVAGPSRSPFSPRARTGTPKTAALPHRKPTAEEALETDRETPDPGGHGHITLRLALLTFRGRRARSRSRGTRMARHGDRRDSGGQRTATEKLHSPTRTLTWRGERRWGTLTSGVLESYCSATARKKTVARVLIAAADGAEEDEDAARAPGCSRRRGGRGTTRRRRSATAAGQFGAAASGHGEFGGEAEGGMRRDLAEGARARGRGGGGLYSQQMGATWPARGQAPAPSRARREVEEAFTAGVKIRGGRRTTARGKKKKKQKE